ncbi:MAG: sigma-70 family RNA polymerase sigma factor [Bacteroidales bacterium]|jgi:RNA polymerase sigma-70 factor (ECF subfamily)|nr:sigma-70 family RNA polymerase sigma factor [Bacteroidales bacterium]
MDLNNMDDVVTIIEGCKKEERQYQHILYKLTYSKMLKICMRYSKDTDEAKDLLQDGYLKIFSKLDSYNFSGPIEGWMRKIFVNNSIDYFNEKKKLRFTNENEYALMNFKDDSDTILESLNEDIITAEKLIELLQELTPVYRTIFNMYYIEDLSHKEISEILNISIGTSKSNVARAKVNLKNLYLEKYEKK